MKKTTKKVVAIIACIMMVVSISSLPASAASKTVNLYMNEKSATYKTKKPHDLARIQYIKNYKESNDGVNVYISFEDKDGNGNTTAIHKFVEPNHIYGSLTNTNWGKVHEVRAKKGFRYWRCTMNSWWWNGENIRAQTKFHAYNE